MKIADKNTTAVSLVEEAFEKAEKYAKYNIFVSLNKEKALEKAAEIDHKIAAGEPVGRLAGVPYALKDNFLSPEGHTTAASKILEPLEAPITATSVQKLEAEGAIMIGRTNLDAFAHGSSTENSYFGVTHNAADFECVAGGSSGGSAVAVALDIVPFATGTDTGGSIRQPASFNGVYGFKPTYGTISRYGVVAMASSTDCVGFFTQNTEDLDLLMEITAGQDPKDLTTLPDFYDEKATNNSSSGRSSRPSLRGSSLRPRRDCGCPSEEQLAASFYRIGIVKNFDSEQVSSEVKDALNKQVEKLKKQGHEIVELDMPTLQHALAVYYIVVPAEVASNLSRYDGIRYGYRAPNAKDLAEIYTQSRTEGFMPENKRRILIGNFVLSSGFYDAYYLKAQKVRALIIKEYEDAFKKCDFILSPVSPSPAFKIGAKTDPLQMYQEDLMSVPVSLAGLPALSIPVYTTEEQLPIGLQLIGPRRSDRTLINFAKELNK